MEWIRVEDRLPPSKKYVLARHNKDNWHDRDDQSEVQFVIVKIYRGLSMADRNKMEEHSYRKNYYSFGDEEGNNKKAYRWRAFGGTSFFGQEITHWMSLPEPPN